MPVLNLDGQVPPLLVGALAIVLAGAYGLHTRHDARRQRVMAALGTALLIGFTGLLERQMGRPLTYRNGPVRLWSGDISSDQNSQQIADPYTFTHVTHGAVFYAMTSLVMPSASAGLRLLTSVGIEGAWESYENTRTVIERYRAVTISLGYYGDSVLNSVCDLLACVAGFWLAGRLPRWATVTLVVAMEIVLTVWIRDNLTLNVLMLVYPLQAIRNWQAGI
jgi:hypothetical protein